MLEGEEISVADDLRHVPSDEETARAKVAPYLGASADERWQALREVLREAGALIANAPRLAEELEPFWPRWRDPSLGRPR